MNIFVVSRGYPERQDPQWGIFEAGQAEALRRLGHKVTIIAVDGRMRLYPRKIGIKHFPDKGVYIYHLFPFKLLGFSRRLVTRVNQWMLRRLFRKVSSLEGEPDVVYAHYLNNMQNCLLLKEEFKGALVGLEHWSELMKPVIAADVDECARRVYPQFDRILTVSPTLRDALNKKFGIEATFVPNMVSEQFIEAPKSANTSGRFEFCAVGRLVDWKNFDLLVKASAMLRDKGFEFGVRIIGSGEEMPRLQQLIATLSLGDRVSLMGVRTRREIIETLGNSDALVLPSDHETFGVVLIEAMAMGLPVIACNAGGPVDIVDESNGFLIPVHDIDALADAMRRMIENHDSFDREKIAADCAAKYSPLNVARKIEKVFAEVLSHKPQTSK